MGFDVWLENRTPFEAATHVQMNADGQEILLAVVSAGFTAPGLDATLEIAEAQLPVQFGDVPYGNPELCSNEHEADLALEKPQPELIVLGQAHAPPGQLTEQIDVSVEAGDIRKRLRVTGDRLRVAGGLSPPRAFETMPIRWERAYGGTLPDGRLDQRNPVGIGYRDARSADPDVLSDVPNITDPDRPDTPVGLTPLGRGWLPRLPLAGTYDDSWLAKQWPLPPHDFKTAYNLCAPADQRSAALGPHTPVRLTNLTPNRVWAFRLPALTAPLTLIYRDRTEVRELEPDTVIIEPDAARVTLKARVAVPIVPNRPKLSELVLGHVSPVWLSARRQGKAYLNPRGGDGTQTDKPLWVA
ncbi:MAG: DUF2169 domain-containing protein [Paracoccaceae bacterium]|nr:DUF2169 domain-containing protein [Paracoccaceae bacterium]